jgi:hypothetical protein
VVCRDGWCFNCSLSRIGILVLWRHEQHKKVQCLFNNACELQLRSWTYQLSQLTNTYKAWMENSNEFWDSLHYWPQWEPEVISRLKSSSKAPKIWDLCHFVSCVPTRIGHHQMTNGSVGWWVESQTQIWIMLNTSERNVQQVLQSRQGVR